MKARIIYYSQTGHTGLYADLLAKRLENLGHDAKAVDYRHTTADDLKKLDLIILGSPVYYLRVPDNFSTWLMKKLPDLTGVSGAVYTTHGGPGDGIRHTQETLAAILEHKGSKLLAIGDFGNMSTFAGTWSLGNSRRTLKYRHLPDETTFEGVRSFLQEALNRLEKGDYLSGGYQLPQIPEPLDTGYKFTKRAITKHRINSDKCIHCGICTRICPVEAIDDATYSINKRKCIACLGCVNRCPTGALEMSMIWRRLQGFERFKKARGISIKKPGELEK